MKLYFDQQIFGRLSQNVLEAMLPYLNMQWSVSQQAELKEPIEKAYRSLYMLAGAGADATLIITSSGAEAVSQVLMGVYLDVARKTGKNHFVTSAIDEAPVIVGMGRLEQLGSLFKMAPPNDRGQITAETIAETITPRTALVSLAWANALTGVIHPIAEIGALCRQRGILFHLDATHVLGKIAIDWEECGADFITFNGEQIGGPQGSGGLFLKKNVNLAPLILGGNDQNGLRGGNLNMSALIGLGCAAEEALIHRDFVCTEVARRKHRFEKMLCERAVGAKVFFPSEERLPHITAIGFPRIFNEALLYLCHRKGLCASMGGGMFQQINLILEACKIPRIDASSAVSFALSQSTTSEDIDRALDILTAAVAQLQKCSHVFGES